MNKMVLLSALMLIMLTVSFGVSLEDMLASQNSFFAQNNLRLEIMEARQMATQRDILSIKNDTLNAVNIQMEAYQAENNKRLDGIIQAFDNRLAVLEAERITAVIITIFVCAVFFIYIIMPWHTAEVKALRHTLKEAKDKLTELQPELPDKSVLIEIKKEVKPEPVPVKEEKVKTKSKKKRV